jgi:hypothetical protein
MSETCQAHAAALDDVRENSKGYCLTAAGEYGQKCTEGVFWETSINRRIVPYLALSPEK